jgi:hypothetical protein
MSQVGTGTVKNSYGSAILVEELGDQCEVVLAVFQLGNKVGGGGQTFPPTHARSSPPLLIGGNKYVTTTLHWSRSHSVDWLKHNMIQAANSCQCSANQECLKYRLC